jgi:transposase
MAVDPNHLPNDVAALQALLITENARLAKANEETAILVAEIARYRAEIEAQKAELVGARTLIAQYKAQLAKLRRQQHGKSSEKLDAQISQLELVLGEFEEFEAEEDARDATRDETGETQKRCAKPPRKPAIRKPLPAHLPRETVTLEPEITCSCCDPKLTKIGEDETEVLEKIPVQLKVIRYIRPKLACRTCEAVFQAPSPDLPISKGRPGPNMIAHVAVAKYCDGLPLNRQSDIYARQGVEIDRQTLADWMGHAAWWFAPLAELIGAHVMSAPAIHADDTPIRVLAPGLGKTRTGRLWNYVVDERPWAGPRAAAAYFRYSGDRKGERPREHLEDYQGFLHADAYSGYDALYRSKDGKAPKVTHVACMAHARRHLFDVYEDTKSPIAEEGLRKIQEIYAIEVEINGKPADVRLAERKARAVPLLDAFKTWAEDQRRRLSSKIGVSKALQYGLTRWEALTRYTTDGRLAIDNNVAERAIRGIAMTRKNFLFLGSDEGGRRAAIFYTIIESAKLQDIDPEAYMADVIDRMAKGHTISRLHELLPWNWKAARGMIELRQHAA